MSEVLVRIGEAAASNTPGDVLTCIGLGSCIALTVADRSRGVAALAHVMLPASARSGVSHPQPHRYADLAVPLLVDLALAHGGRPAHLDAVLVGGAAMFDLGGAGNDVGARNEAAVREHLDRLRVPVCAAATGGGKGRSVRVHVGAEIAIAVREAGGRDTPLLGIAAGVAA
jgi:chemotaxis protein CheD